MRPPASAIMLHTPRFQSTHPYGCDLAAYREKYRIKSFNPRTHTGATRLPVSYSATGEFQSTHPYGCDDTLCALRDRMGVSIHAPIRVRPARGTVVASSLLFQSTHPYGCDGTWNSTWRKDSQFQSTHPYGCDVGVGKVHGPNRVSIHAPIRVRHFSSHSCHMTSYVSIHAPIRVRHGEKDIKLAEMLLFQSTHPYGCDGLVDFTFHVLGVSIHAPIRVRRQHRVSHISLRAVSIHAPIRVRHVCVSFLSSCRRFNPRTHTGATGWSWDDACTGDVSIHAPIRVRP